MVAMNSNYIYVYFGISLSFSLIIWQRCALVYTIKKYKFTKNLMLFYFKIAYDLKACYSIIKYRN